MCPASPTRSERASFDPKSVRCVGLVPALHKRRIAAAVRDVVHWFRRRDICCLLPDERASALSMPDLAADLSRIADEADLLLAMGGDGTFLATARLAAPSGKPATLQTPGAYPSSPPGAKADNLCATRRTWIGFTHTVLKP